VGVVDHAAGELEREAALRGLGEPELDERGRAERRVDGASLLARTRCGDGVGQLRQPPGGRGRVLDREQEIGGAGKVPVAAGEQPLDVLALATQNRPSHRPASSDLIEPARPARILALLVMLSAVRVG
jgi:hypothetical protein